jgi:CDP-L-myo-inositol myo-inositolphosphotransferase
VSIEKPNFSAPGSLVVVPPDVLLAVTLFQQQLPEQPTWLESEDGAAVLCGPAQALSPLLSDLSLAADLPRTVALAGSLFAIGTYTERQRALWSVLKQTGKPTDGWVARHFNRPISRVFSFVLLSLGLRASHASAITLLVGLFAALIAARPGYIPLVIMGLLFQMASVLDGVDGEMARATLTESNEGARLDAIVDQVTYVACFVGVTWGWAREGGGMQVLAWTGAIAVALVLSLLRGAQFVQRFAPDASFVFIDRTVRRAARESDLMPLRMAASGFTLLRRDLFAVVFFLVSLLGRRILIPALVVFGIVLANVTLTAYRREIEAAALLERSAAL